MKGSRAFADTLRRAQTKCPRCPHSIIGHDPLTGRCCRFIIEVIDMPGQPPHTQSARCGCQGAEQLELQWPE